MSTTFNAVPLMQMPDPVVTALHDHTSPETAYVIGDYPYGFHLRCKMRVWTETHPTRGTRMMTQTTNPKYHAREFWNKPKASTYCRLGLGLYLDDAGHVQSFGVSEYSDLVVFQRFLAHWPEHRVALNRWTTAKGDFHARLAACNRVGRSGFTLNGEECPMEPGALEANEKAADGWFSL